MAENPPKVPEDLSLSAERRVDDVCRRYEAAWQAGEQPRPEQYLEGWTGDERALLLHELTRLELAYRRRAGLASTATRIRDSSIVNPANLDPNEDLPRSFGRYTLHKLLGRGGMGRVYLAYDPQLDRQVALKIPTPFSPTINWRDRFLTEAKAAARLRHPHVCPVYDVGEQDSQPYLTMAYIEGETLANRLSTTGPLSTETAVELLLPAARAMAEAHSLGIVHRDLKPANLMIDSRGEPIVMDFGLALRTDQSDDLRMTLTGVAMGTPAYMPPEQASGEHDIGPASDVYSLGVILYEMICGRTPFRAASFGKLLAQIERDVPPVPSSLVPGLPQALDAIILTALAKSPTKRFPSAAEFADALEQFLAGDQRIAGTIRDRDHGD